VTAWERARLEPSGFTGISLSTSSSFLMLSMTAGPLAMHSTRIA
jgi:hypothetical protein